MKMLDVIKNYILVVKPSIVCGNMICVAGGFLLASRGQVDSSMLQSTLIGTSLVVASGCVFNNCIDRRLDRQMVRTQNRVLAKGAMSPRAAVIYASLLGVAGTALLRAATNLLCIAVLLAGFAIYVGLYSLYLKPKSVYSTLIGSLAGAAPPLVGYCAVTNRFDLGASILLSIFSLWQIPHAYAIAVFRLKDYAAAAIPVLPAKRGLPATRKHIIGYILAFMAAALMLTIGGYTGRRFLAVATVIGLFWLTLAWSGCKAGEDQLWAKRLFVFSIVSITVLSVMMAIDFSLPVPSALLLTSAP
jgi:protoheme IX farnesyltransferase